MNDKPVATCALFFSDDIAGIFDVVTVPEVQRKGAATKMMLYALREANGSIWFTGKAWFRRYRRKRLWRKSLSWKPYCI